MSAQLILTRVLGCRAVVFIATVLLSGAASAASGEVDALLARLLQTPTITPVPTFQASMLLRPASSTIRCGYTVMANRYGLTTTAVKKATRAAVFWPSPATVACE